MKGRSDRTVTIMVLEVAGWIISILSGAFSLYQYRVEQQEPSTGFNAVWLLLAGGFVSGFVLIGLAAVTQQASEAARFSQELLSEMKSAKRDAK